MRKSIFFVISIMAIFFIVGGIAAYLGYIDTTGYALVGGIVGSLASILGLISLTMPRLNAADLKEVGAELVNEVATANAQVGMLQEKIRQNRDEIGQLELQKAEIELIVKKTATRIFLEERLISVGNQIKDYIDRDKKLCELVENYVDIIESARKIDEQIQGEKNADIIKHVFAVHRSMERRRERYEKSDTVLTVMVSLGDVYISLARKIVELLSKR